MVPRRNPMPDGVTLRIQALALDIAHRLRPVCAHMPDEELLELATRMATVELKYFEAAAAPQPPRLRTANG
jgi:hypothetical protein